MRKGNSKQINKINEDDKEKNSIYHEDDDTITMFNNKKNFESNNANRRERKTKYNYSNSIRDESDNKQFSTADNTLSFNNNDNNLPNLLEQHNNNISREKMKTMIKNKNNMIYHTKDSIKENNNRNNNNNTNENIKKNNNENINISNDMNNNEYNDVDEILSFKEKIEKAILILEKKTDEIMYIKSFNIFDDSKMIILRKLKFRKKLSFINYLN
jgi:hypothetical protein